MRRALRLTLATVLGVLLVGAVQAAPASAGNIVVFQDAQPNDAQDFSFTAGGGLTPTFFQLDDDGNNANGLSSSRSFTGLAPGPGYSVSQSTPLGWDPADVTCSDGSPPSNIDVGASETVTCTFVNLPTVRGQLTVRVDQQPDSGEVQIFRVDGTAVALNDNGTTTDGFNNLHTVVVTPGTHDIELQTTANDGQSPPPGGHYWQVVSSSCSDGSDPAAIEVSDGEHVTCDFAVVRAGFLEVIIENLPDQSPDDFAFTAGGGLSPSSFTLDDDSAGPLSNVQRFVAPTGSGYSLTETVPPGWDLTSATCDDGSPVSNIALSADERNACRFFNTKQGTVNGQIVVRLDARPDDPQVFAFTASNGLFPPSFTLDDNGNETDERASSISLPAAQGTYAIGAQLPNGWRSESRTCSNGDDPSAVDVTAGETVYCDFVFGKPGQIRIVQAQSPEVIQTFSYMVSGPGAGGSLILDDNGIEEGGYPSQYTLTNLQAASYSFTQSTPAGWNPPQSSCSDGSSANSIDLDYGESITCTFSNEPIDPRYLTVLLDRRPDIHTSGLMYTVSGNGVSSIQFSLGDFPWEGGGSGTCCPRSQTILAKPGVTYSITHGSTDGFETSFDCDNGDPNEGVDVGPGEHVTCTDIHQRKPVIAVVLEAEPPSGQQFNFTVTGPETRSFSAYDTSPSTYGYFAASYEPGTYSIAQSSPTSWELTSATCDNGDPVSSVTVEIGDDTVTCTFVNELTEPATLTVRLDLIPDGPGYFNYRMNGGPTAVTSILLEDDGIAGNPYSNVHTITVVPASGYNLFLPGSLPSGISQLSATCSDGSSPSSISFSPNENVTCTFRYVRAPSITAVVDAQPNAGQDFAFTAGGGLSPTSFSLDDDGDENNALGSTRTYSSVTAASGYSLAQSLPSFWTQQSATCSDGSSPANIDVGANENVICTFTNVPNYPGYARPKAATPIVAPLVPAYQPCASPNRVHAQPLSFGSCNPPLRTSTQLTIGTPDANGAAARSVSYLKMVRMVGDLHLIAHLDDVRRTDLSDYTGELETRFSFKLTDKGSEPVPTNATTQPFGLSVTVPCTATADTSVGAACDLVTDVNALLPGALVDGRRAMFETGQIEVYDGGPDSDADTQSGNTVFMRQGIFVP